MKIDNHLFEVEFFNFGREKYYVDGQLIEKRWNLYFTGTRKFKIGSRDVQININCIPTNYYCQLFVDNKLHAEQLFPEINKKIKIHAEKRKAIEPRIKVAKAFIVALVICAIAVTVYNEVRLAP
ncbi:hypothetical protein AAFN46_20355 [Pseudomonas sp. CAU 1711]|uniref:hypothetical protein n=1 Tax=Pseudomonas sp. CAU 1711 TaxID=3140356 RepID=UPI0032606B0F